MHVMHPLPEFRALCSLCSLEARTQGLPWPQEVVCPRAGVTGWGRVRAEQKVWRLGRTGLVRCLGTSDLMKTLSDLGEGGGNTQVRNANTLYD